MKYIIIILILNILGFVAFILNFFMEKYTKIHQVTVEHAKTVNEIKNGLMYRTEKLKKNHGMLFHTGYKISSFWMKNTYISLDVIFLDENFKVIGFIEKNKPLSLKKITINKPSHYVLEMNSGWVIDNNVQIGDFIHIK